MCDLTDLVTTSFQKWGPIISEISRAYSDHHNGRSRSNYDSDSLGLCHEMALYSTRAGLIHVV